MKFDRNDVCPQYEPIALKTCTIARFCFPLEYLDVVGVVDISLYFISYILTWFYIQYVIVVCIHHFSTPSYHFSVIYPYIYIYISSKTLISFYVRTFAHTRTYTHTYSIGMYCADSTKERSISIAN